MKVPELLQFSKPVLAGAVKLSQRKQLVDEHGSNWHAWVQAQTTGKKLSDPRRYTTEQLAGFLASLKAQTPDPRAPGKALVKPQKLLKRYLPWLAARIQHDKVMSGGSADGAAAAGWAAAKGGRKGKKGSGGKKGKKAAAGADAAAGDDAAGTAEAVADPELLKRQQQLKADPVWQLMQRTRNHPRFHYAYAFDSYDKGWICTGRPSEDVAEDDAAAAADDDDAADGATTATSAASLLPSGPWRLVGVDCEMCVTKESEKELLQVALVDEDEQLLLQELVLPSGPVLDFRTELTGITAGDLEGVTLTRKGAAKRIAKLLTPNTVLVGHGLHHDLQALQLDHPYVIDTSMLFEFKGLSSFIPPLALLSEQLLGKALRGRDPTAPVSSTQQQPQHDSREDASIALALVKRELQQGKPTPPLDPPKLEVDKADLAKLCVHKLPATVAANNSSSSSSLSPEAVGAAVKASLAAACRQAGAQAAAEAVEAAAVEQPGDTSKQLLYLVFKHAGVANDVFQQLPGAVFTDSVGRHSKRQGMLGSSHKVVVRKMACHNGLVYGKDKAADRGAKSKHTTKKRKAPPAAVLAAAAAAGGKPAAAKHSRSKKAKPAAAS